MDEQTIGQLETLYSMIERNVSHGEIERGGVPAITIGIRPGETFTLRGDAYYLLRDLSEKLARPGYAAPGLSLEGARTLLTSACSRAISEGLDSATRWLISTLDSAPRGWVVTRPINLTARDTPFTVGNARIQRGLPDAVRYEDDWVKAEFPAFTITCEVEAWDRDAALLLADRVFHDAISILQLADRQGQPRVGSAAVTISDKGQSFSHSTDRSSSVLSSVTSEGELIGVLDALSKAAVSSKPTDWDQRTLSSARWVALGIEAKWPSEALVSFMTALEALLVTSKKGEKKSKIARTASRVVQLRGMSTTELEDWLKDLYDRRNEVIHQSLSFDDEIEVDRLADVAWICVRWAANHLRPFHGLADHPCGSLKEALECDQRVKALGLPG